LLILVILWQSLAYIVLVALLSEHCPVCYDQRLIYD
jgi:hypothetical protein